MCKPCEGALVPCSGAEEGMRMHLSGIWRHDCLWAMGNDVNLSEVLPNRNGQILSENLYNTRQLKEPLFPGPKNISRSKRLQPRLLGACVQLSVCLSTICSCWPTFSFCLDFYSPQAAVSRSWCCWGNNQYCSHFNLLATEKAKSNIEVSQNKLGQQTALFKLLLHYNCKAVRKRLIDILICHKFTASTPLSSVPFCRVLGKCQSRL